MSASKSNRTVDLQQIVDVIPQMITVLAPGGMIIYANQAVLDYTGLTIDDVMKSDFRDRVFHPEDIDRLRDERQQALARGRSEEHTSELQSRRDLVCRLLLEKKKKKIKRHIIIKKKKKKKTRYNKHIHK